MSLLSIQSDECVGVEETIEQEIQVQKQVPQPTKLGKARWATWIAVFSAVALSLPLSMKLWGQLWVSDQYSFFPIIFVASAFLAASRGMGRVQTQPLMQPSGLTWLFLCFASLALAYLFRSPWIGWMSMLFALRAGENLLFDLEVTRALRGPWLLLWMTLPLPFGLDTSLVVSLQKYASAAASSILDSLSIPNILSGVTIRTPEKSFMVENACSGINSFYACLALVAIFVVWNRYSFLRSILLLVGAAFWTVVFNTLRVVAIVYFDTQGYGRLDEGTPHDVLGAITFIFSLLATFSLNSFFCYVAPLKIADQERSTSFFSMLGEKLHRGVTWNARANISFGIAVAATVLLITSVAYASRSTNLSSVETPQRNFHGVLPAFWGQDLLPAELDGWRQTGFKNVLRDPSNPFGSNSLIWEYRKGLIVAEVSIDGPYGTWHDLWYCYSGLNWNLDQAKVVSLNSSKTTLPFTHLSMHRNEIEEAHVWFACFDSNGSTISPPPASNTAIRKIINRLERNLIDHERHPAPVYQCQVFLNTLSSPLPAEIEMLEGLAAQVGGVLKHSIEATPADPPKQ